MHTSASRTASAAFLAGLLACAPTVAAPEALAERPSEGEPAAVVVPSPSGSASSLADASEATSEARPRAASEGHEASAPLPRLCVGATPPPDRGHTAACCYPAKEQLVGPLRRAAPEFRRCFEARRDARAGGRVVFTFRIEQDGHVAQACAEPSTTFPDAAATRCMLEVVTKLAYPSMSDEELRLCGLTRLTYPIELRP